jgi:polyhydroxybutyrate depolymerase
MTVQFTVRRDVIRARLPFVAGVIAAAAFATSCGSGGAHKTPTTLPTATAIAVAPTNVSTVAPRPSAGCTAGAQQASGATPVTITVGGTDRMYRRYLPDGSATQPLPLIINLHGLTSNVDQQVAVSAFESLAATEKFIVLTPAALGTPTSWQFNKITDNADLAFMGAMLDQVEAATCVDLARVYATGISDGGLMSSLLACTMGSRIAAIGLVSGIVHPTGCDPGRAMPLMVFWGKKDVVLPYCGGLGPVVAALVTGKPLTEAGAPSCPPANFGGFPPVEDAIATWVSADGCNPAPTVLPAGSDVEERIFTGCKDDATARFFVVADGGHTWPGSKLMEAISSTVPGAAIIGFTTDEIDATRLIWSFFRGYALAAP